MTILHKIIMPALVTAAVSVSAMAQDTVLPVTITVDKSNGTLARADGDTSNTWCSVWTSTATSPGATFSAPVNNMQWSGENIDARTGSAQSSVYTVASASTGWYVSSYSFKFVNIGTGTKTLTAGSKVMTSSSTEQTWSVTDIAENVVPSFTMTGSNDGVLLTDFSIVLSPRTQEIQPAFVTTTVVDGEFAPETNWYTLQIGAGGLYLKYEDGASSMSLNSPQTTLEDKDLWCFVGDDTEGYQIYNKAAGTEMRLAAPSEMKGTTGGSSYAVLKPADVAGYVYVWHFTETNVLGVGTPAFFVNLDGNENAKLNNRDGKLAFWTGGADAGSAIQVMWSKQTFTINADNGTMGNVPGKPSTWYMSWTRDAAPSVVMSSVANNMQFDTDGTLKIASGIEYGPWAFTAPQGMHVSSYEFDVKRAQDAGSATLSIDTPDGKTVEVTDEFQHVAVTGIGVEDANGFTVDADPADANKCVNVKNFNVTVSRSIEISKNIMVFRYDGTTGYNVCYRIPAITTVENGPNKGRLIAINDYRYGGGDIGAGRIDLYQSHSDDNGLTWSEPGHLCDAEGNHVAEGNYTTDKDCAFGDAAIVSDRETGKVLMIAVGGHVNFFASRRDAPNFCFRWYSEDGGDTWSDHQDITEQILSIFDGEAAYGKIDGQFFGSGRMTQSRQIKVGDYYRLYAVLSSQNDGGNTRNWALYSDDFGQTWHILGGVPAVSSNGDEPKAEELPDGSVLLAARNRWGNRNFNVFRYTDVAKGEGSWLGTVATDMGMGSINACDGEIMILPVRNIETQEKCYMALQSFPYGGSRRNVSIAWKALSQPEDFSSPSSFTTWDGRKQVSNLGSAYSTMCWQHDNTLGFLFEEETFGKAYCGMFRNLTIEEITGDAYEYCADEDDSVRQGLTSAMIRYRLETEAPKGEPGKYVGQPTGEGNPEAEEAAAAYDAEPTLDNYILFNKAITTGSAIEIKHGGIYRLQSAHNGTYTFGDRYLTTDGSKLTSSASHDTSASTFIFMNKSEDSKNWIIYHPDHKVFVAQSPAAVETAFTMTPDPAMAHEYRAVSTMEGYTNLTDVQPGHSNYGSIHQGGNNNGHIVVWTSDAQASQWYMELVGMADESELPDMNVSIDEIGVSDKVSPVKYYDITGREVAVPVLGGLYITSERTKVIF